MSMTSYAMPAHLALNLVWLWLYLDPTRRRFWLAPVIGVAALGLHQPFLHALFVTPFLFRFVLDRRWKAVIWFGLIYLTGAVFWFFWWRHFLPGFLGSGRNSAFGVHKMTAVIQLLYCWLLLGWLALPIPLLATLGFIGIRRQRAFLQDAAISCLLTFGFYIFVKLDQGHGWGDRYFHSALGCLILIALVGWESLCQRMGKASALKFVWAGTIVSLLVQFPLRCFQAEAFVQPYASAAWALHHADVDLVVLDPRLAWYSADLRRNDPFFQQRPIILTTLQITKENQKILANSFPHPLFVSENRLKELGMATAQAH
jgi:hypothetical protein